VWIWRPRPARTNGFRGIAFSTIISLREVDAIVDAIDARSPGVSIYAAAAMLDAELGWATATILRIYYEHRDQRRDQRATKSALNEPTSPPTDGT
jgi:hypothetical protein